MSSNEFFFFKNVHFYKQNDGGEKREYFNDVKEKN